VLLASQYQETEEDHKSWSSSLRSLQNFIIRETKSNRKS
jgi:hypothetical protein